MDEIDEAHQRALSYKLWQEELAFLFNRIASKFHEGSKVTLIVVNDKLVGDDRDFCWTMEPTLDHAKEAIDRIAARSPKQEVKEVGKVVEPHLNVFALKVVNKE